MTIDLSALAALASDYTHAMTSIRGRRVQRLLSREFVSAEYVLPIELADGAAAVLGLWVNAAALCCTDGRGKEVAIVAWPHAAKRARETRFDLLKDSLPALATAVVPLARVAERAPVRADTRSLTKAARALLREALAPLT